MTPRSLRLAVFHDLPSGGAKRALREQVKGLVSLGHEVSVYVPSTAEEHFLPLAADASDVQVFPRTPQPDREQALERGPSPAVALRWLHYLAGVRRSEHEIAAAIDAGQHNVVLVAASQFTQAPWLLRWLRTPTVYYCQEPLRAAHEPRIAPPLTRFLIRHTLGRLDRVNTRAATVLAVNSRFSASRIEAAYHRPVHVNYLGVDTQRFRPLPEERGNFVLTVAALHPLKGLDFLVDALGRMAPGQRPPMVVVSDRSRQAERQRLEASASQNGVKLDFRFRVSEEELVRLYNQARVVVYAPYNEPFGFVPLEAMACGRPVLAICEGGIPETVTEGETGFLAERNPDHFAARLTELLARPEWGERVSQQAVQIVREQWSWSRSVSELADLLRQAAGTAEVLHSH